MWTVLLGWSNGANDAANSMGAAVGAGALTLRQAVLAGAVAEVTGASLLGVHVSKTISKGVIRTDDYAANPSVFSFAMVAVLVGAAVTTIAATYFKLPISATHGIVGGLIGVGALAHGWGSLGGPAIAKTVASWVISPVLGGAVAFALFLLVHRLVFRAGDPLRNSRRMQPLFTALTAFIVALFLMLKGPEQVRFWKEGTFTAPLLVSLGLGGLGAGATLLFSRAAGHGGGGGDAEDPLLAKSLPEVDALETVMAEVNEATGFLCFSSRIAAHAIKEAIDDLLPHFAFRADGHLFERPPPTEFTQPLERDALPRDAVRPPLLFDCDETVAQPPVDAFFGGAADLRRRSERCLRSGARRAANSVSVSYQSRDASSSVAMRSSRSGASPSLDTSATERSAPPRFSSAASGASFVCNALIAAMCSIFGAR